MVIGSGLKSTLLGSTGWCAMGDRAVVSVVGVDRGAVPVHADIPWVGGVVLCRIGIGGGFLHVSADSGDVSG